MGALQAQRTVGGTAVAGDGVAVAPLVMAEGLGIRRSGRWLLRSVDLAVRPGRSP